MKKLAALPWGRVLGAALLCILSFPRVDLDTGLSVDNALAWAFNHLFTTGLEQGAHIVFPHGPLAFILYPQALGGDLTAALIGLLGVLGVYYFAMLSIGTSADRSRTVLVGAVAAGLAPILQVHLQLVAIVGCGLLLHWRTESRGWLGLSLLVALLALHVRAGVGVMTCGLLAMHAILLLWKRHAWRTVLVSFGLFAIAAIALRLLLFGTLYGIGTYYAGLWELTRASSAAVGLHPENDWWSIGGAIIAFFSVPLLARDREVKQVFVLFLPVLYAAWKHGMTREDVEHTRGLFIIALLIFSLAIFLAQRTRPSVVVAMAVSLILGYHALLPTGGYKELTVVPVGVNRLHDWVFAQDALAASAIERSKHNLQPQRLPEALVQRLAQGTVDCYPWDYTYIPANDLLWRPRPVVQSYASYTPWLDEQNARFFRNAKGADRIIWHLGKDRWGGRMDSPDGRYLLNDEPQALLAMLDNYTWTAGNDQVAILERSAPGKFQAAQNVGNAVCAWDTWITVPRTGKGILRAKVDVQGTLYRALKDFAYKDAEYTVLYRTIADSTYTYRFIPDLAREGIWVAPFIMHPELPQQEPAIAAIRFNCSEPAMVQKTFTVQWELIPLADPAKEPATLFGKSADAERPPLRHSQFGFETAVDHWQWHGEHTDSAAHAGRYAFKIAPEGYTPAYEIALDSLSAPITVRAEAWVLATAPAPKTELIISVVDSAGTVYWEAVDARSFLLAPNEWWRVHLERTVPTGPGRRLKVYLWNTGATPLLVDDLGVELLAPR
jgi:hypothetical protein